MALMMKTTNLGQLISQHLPSELGEFIRLAGIGARAQGQRLFLVGGVVRDLLLGQPNLDLDLVAEANAIGLAENLAKLMGGKVIAYSRFNTAKVQWGRWSVDFATARAEWYSRPGALPSVQCQCDIKDDLGRRDFTINAMAVSLLPDEFGNLIDLHEGRVDLEKRIIRILHDNSFQDDATRIWRALRYEQRLDFTLDRHTLSILRRDIDFLATISGDRIRHEMELCLEEDRPEKCLVRADELGVLARIRPALQMDNWLSRKIRTARGLTQPYCQPLDLYFAFLVYRLEADDLEYLIHYLKLSGTLARTLRETSTLKKELPGLNQDSIPSSAIYRCLQPFSINAVFANMLATDLPLVRERIGTYLNKLRHVRTSLSGEDLINLNLASGPQVKTLLEAIRLARLDGQVGSKDQEIALAKQIALSH